MGKKSRQRQKLKQEQTLQQQQLEDPASLFPGAPGAVSRTIAGGHVQRSHRLTGVGAARSTVTTGQEEADDDWELFLKMLAAELCPGCGAYGQTVAICPTQTEGRRRRQRGRKTREEEEWCTQCMQYGHEEHHCLEVFQDTDLEWEEPECPAPEWEEPERPAPEWEEPECPDPKRGESVRPEPRRGKAKCPQSRYLPAKGEFLLVPPPPPWEDCVSLPPPPAEEEYLLVLPPSPPPVEGACLLVPLLLPYREPEEVELPSREPEEVELPSREPEGVDSDTIWNELHSSSTARMAVGCVIELASKVASRELKNGFAVVRPPGHHAEESTAIIQCVLFCFYYRFQTFMIILNQYVTSGPIFPLAQTLDTQCLATAFFRSVQSISTGLRSGDYEGHSRTFIFCGSHLGEGYNVNIAWTGGLEPPMGDVEYLMAFRAVVVPIATEFNPDVVLVSAGFDAVEGHDPPLGGYKVTAKCKSLLVPSV
ncbi:UNVERIFIED_CONTAM: hypothetical protein FKN15_020897 [Acipenser sinensis]